MRESEVVIITEKIQGEELPRCVYDMYARINNLHNFRVVLAAGERLLSIYNYNQVGTDIKKVPELCNYFDVEKMKLCEILHGERYGKEEDSKKPLKCITPEPVPVKKDLKNEKEEKDKEPPIKESKKGGKRSAPKTSTPKKLTPKKAKKTKTTLTT